MEQVTLHLPPDMLHLGARIARQRGIALDDLLRVLLAQEIARASVAQQGPAAGDVFIAPLRARVSADFASAHNWHDLQNRLGARGYRLHADGDGLALHRHPSALRLCDIADLGFSHARLVARFGAGFPGQMQGRDGAPARQAVAPGQGPGANANRVSAG